MRKIKYIITLSLLASSVLIAGGYKIPETSTNGVALSAANVAHSQNADAAYYNPANMSFMPDENALEMDLMVVSLDATNFKGTTGGLQDGVDIDAQKELFYIPSINYVSPKMGDFRLGLSVAVPGGLTKRWEDQPAKGTAEEFSLQIVEINPTVSYLINEQIAVAAGIRVLHSEGVVKSSNPATASRNLIGESFDFGYNLALTYKSSNDLELALTYRSNVDLTEEGNAKLYIGSAKVYDGGTDVSVPLPAFLNLALAYTFESKTTVEFVYERSFWSAYDTLDFGYVSSIPLLLVSSMDGLINKDWKDTNAFRIGVTQELDSMTLMAGLVIDETPVPDETVSFELPGSDSFSVSFGARYDIDKEWNVGIAALYSMRDDRVANNDDIKGTFSNSNVLIVSAGVGYKF